MQKRVFTVLIALSLIWFVSGTAQATHLVDHHQGEAIDFIDGIFSAGGGSLNGSLSPSGSLDWFLFAANAGDLLTIETVSPISNFDTGLSLVVDLLDGNPQVGDVLNQGTELTWLAEDDDSGVGLLSRIDYNIVNPATYAIALGGFAGSTGLYTVQLSGNTANVDPVPEPATMLLFGTGIACVVITRIRRKKGMV